jgi:hypothetical protein
MKLKTPITVPTISGVVNPLPPDEEFDDPVDGLDVEPRDEEVRLGLLNVLCPTWVVEPDSPAICELSYPSRIGHIEKQYQNIPVAVTALPELDTAAAAGEITLVPAVEYPFSMQ